MYKFLGKKGQMYVINLLKMKLNYKCEFNGVDNKCDVNTEKSKSYINPRYANRTNPIREAFEKRHGSIRNITNTKKESVKSVINKQPIVDKKIINDNVVSFDKTKYTVNGKKYDLIYSTGNNIYKNLTDAEVQAINDYTGNQWTKINKGLTQNTEMSDSTNRTIKNLDSIFKNAKMPEDIQVFRGINPKTYNTMLQINPELEKIGSTIKLKNFSSTSIREDVAKKFAGTGPIVELYVPKGTSGFMIPHSEDEILLNRNIKIKVVGIRKKGSRKVVTWQVEQ